MLNVLLWFTSKKRGKSFDIPLFLLGVNEIILFSFLYFIGFMPLLFR
jgi:hypothetical protein